MVFVLLDTRVDLAVLQGMLTGEPEPLRSAFRLTYRMLLGLPWQRSMQPEQLIAASFRQFQV